MSKTALVHARIEPGTKSRAESILHRLGMSPTEAIRLFYTQITLHQGLPFSLRIPNKLTRKTLDESRHGKDIHSFESLDDMFKSWES